MNICRFGCAVVALCLVMAWAPSGASAQDAPPRVGDLAPPPTIEQLLEAPSGTPSLDPESWDRWRGRTLVLEFSTSWCGPCLAMIPHMNGLVDHLADEIAAGEVAIVTLSNESEERIMALRDAQGGLRTLVARDIDGSTFEDYWVNGIPYALIIDPEGRIAAMTHPAHITPDAIRNVIKGVPIDLPVTNASPRRVRWDHFGEGAGADARELRAELERVATRDPVMRRSLTGSITSGGLAAQNLLATALDVPMSDLVFETDLPERLYFRVDIQAPDGSNETARQILRAQLEEALAIRVDRELRETEVLALRRTDDAEPLSPVQERGGASMRAGDIDLQGRTFEELAGTIQRFSNRIVVDETGLEGLYAIRIRWDLRAGPDAFRDALEELGLELVPKTAMHAFSVIRDAE